MALTPATWPEPGGALAAINSRAGLEQNPFVILGHANTPKPVEKPHVRKLISAIPRQDGEQYRFHFDMSKCIGCKCCEVACAEQNNLPPDISWRRVGEVEGGTYPNTQRLLSMGAITV